MRLRDPELRAVLAGRYVLGTLRGPARRRFAKMLRTDPLLRGEVEQWELRLNPLLDAIPEEPPPPRVWNAICEQLDREAPRDRSSLVRRMRGWRTGAALATAASALLAAVLLAQHAAPPPSPAPPVAVAVVADAEARVAWLVRLDTDIARVQVSTLRPQLLPDEKSFELWMIADASSAPRSLGLIPPDGETALRLAQPLADELQHAAAVAVSLEPGGGSPTGTPTGPVLYQGDIRPLR